MRRIQLLVGITITVLSVMGADGQSEPIEHFVTRPFIHGVPKEKAKEYGPEAVQRLHEMLDEPAYKPHLSRVIATLGYIGNEESVPLLKELYEKHIAVEGVIKPSKEESHLKDALDSIRRAMAMIGAKGNAEAIQFLKDNCDVAKLQAREAFKKYDEKHFNYACRETMVSSMMALSMAGTDEAIKTLREIKRNAQSVAAELGASPLFVKGAQEALTKAIEAKEKRNKKGK